MNLICHRSNRLATMLGHVCRKSSLLSWLDLMRRLWLSLQLIRQHVQRERCHSIPEQHCRGRIIHTFLTICTRLVLKRDSKVVVCQCLIEDENHMPWCLDAHHLIEAKIESLILAHLNQTRTRMHVVTPSRCRSFLS